MKSKIITPEAVLPANILNDRSPELQALLDATDNYIDKHDDCWVVLSVGAFTAENKVVDDRIFFAGDLPPLHTMLECLPDELKNYEETL